MENNLRKLQDTFLVCLSVMKYPWTNIMNEKLHILIFINDSNINIYF